MTNYMKYNGKKYAIWGYNTREAFAKIEAKTYNERNPKRHAIVVHSYGKYYIISRKK